MGTINKTYRGKSYEFTLGKYIGKGGNGTVYECNIANSLDNNKYAVKILSVDKWKNRQMKELRYKRFHKEIYKVLDLQKDMPGIMKILDFYCPDQLTENEEVWYLMYKAQRFHDLSNRYDLNSKLKYLLDLSNIICNLHDRGYSHRDIKVDNLLVIGSQLLLSDFGLIWNVDDSRITGDGERLGPYYIGPPELESRYVDMDDFRPADVYLFGKVVWMLLRDDTIGFRGEYKRDNKQFYLNPVNFGIDTFEPIHRLLEKSTKTETSKRIDIKKCRDYLKEQISIVNEPKINKDLLYEYRFDELQKEIVGDYEPEERIYQDFRKILKILERITPISSIVIIDSDEIIIADSIEKWKVDKSLVFKSTANIGLVYSYLCYPDYIKQSNKDAEFELYIKKVDREDVHTEFVSYKESRRLKWNHASTSVLLDEPLLIRFKARKVL